MRIQALRRHRLRCHGLLRQRLRCHGLLSQGLLRHGLLSHGLRIQRLLEVAERRSLLLHLSRSRGSLAWPRERRGRLGRRGSGGILKAGDVGDLRGRRCEEVMGVLTRRMLLVLLVLVLVLVLMVLLLLLVVLVPVGVRWVRRRVLRERRGWLVGWVVRRRKRSSETKREAGVTICARHGDRIKI